MPQTNFPQGFQAGLMLRGMPLLQTNPGNVFWVSNATPVSSLGGQNRATAGADGNPGTFNRPFATLAGALLKCTANQGDIIFVKPGHAETVNGAGTTTLSTGGAGTTLSFNVAGVSIIGLGAGATRPTLTFAVANTANIPVTSANMSLQNFLVVGNFLSIASAFTATGTTTPTDFNIESCEFKDTSSVLGFVAGFTGNATANSCDGLRVANCRISSLGTAAGTIFIKLLSGTDRVQVKDNYGNWAVLNDTAAMLDGSTFQLTNLDFARNVLQRPNTSSTGGSFVSGSGNAWTGHAYDNYMYQVDNTAGIWISTGHGSAFGYSNNFSPITGAVDKSALINPAAV